MFRSGSAAAAVVLALTTGCDKPAVFQPPTQLPDGNPTPVRRYDTVTIGDNFYNPNPLTVTVGTRVFWVHKGLDQHTVSFDPPITFFSGLMNRTDAAQRQFNNPGYYSYHCDIHQGMRAFISVRAPD
jgi:plastocyanin